MLARQGQPLGQARRKRGSGPVLTAYSGRGRSGAAGVELADAFVDEAVQQLCQDLEEERLCLPDERLEVDVHADGGMVPLEAELREIVRKTTRENPEDDTSPYVVAVVDPLFLELRRVLGQSVRSVANVA